MVSIYGCLLEKSVGFDVFTSITLKTESFYNYH